MSRALAVVATLESARRAHPVAEPLLAGALAAAGAAVVAGKLDIVAPSVVAAAADAWLVRRGLPGAFGGDAAPVLSLLALPYSAVGTVVLLPGLLLGAAIVAFTHGALAQRGVPAALRWGGSAAVALNPVWLYVTATGVATAGGALAALIGGYGVVRWLQARSLPWLLAAAAAFATGTLVWYPALAWACGALALLVTAHVRMRCTDHEAAGVLLVFLLPPAFAVGAWTVLAWSQWASAPAWLAGPAVDNVVAAPVVVLLAALAPLAVALAGGSRHPLVVASMPALATAVMVGVLQRAGGATATVALMLLPTVTLLVLGATRPRAVISLAAGAAIAVTYPLLALSMRADAGHPTARQFGFALTGDRPAGGTPSAIRVGRWLARFSAPDEVNLASLDRRSRNMVAYAAGMPELATAPATAPVRVVDTAQRTADGRWHPFTAGRLAVETAEDW